MFALPTSYQAERQVFETQPDGSIKSSWQPCRVIGVTKDDEDELAYVVEVLHRREAMLHIEPYVRRLEPGNPL